MTYDEASKMVEKEIKRNPGLAKMFKEHPERKEMYIHKILDSWDEVWDAHALILYGVRLVCSRMENHLLRICRTKVTA